MATSHYTTKYDIIARHVCDFTAKRPIAFILLLLENYTKSIASPDILCATLDSWAGVDNIFCCLPAKIFLRHLNNNY